MRRLLDIEGDPGTIGKKGEEGDGHVSRYNRRRGTRVKPTLARDRLDAMTVRDDANALLKFLAECKAEEDDPRQGHHQLAGSEITKWTKLPPPRVNDAVALLEGRRLVRALKALGTAPYSFMQVGATAEGRHANEERNRALEEEQRQKKNEDTWENYPEGDAAELVPLLRRAAFDRDLTRACGEASTLRPVALVMVDIDHFKKVNDTCGHQGGDRVLVGVAQALRAVVGRKGRGYRYGGEELAAILPDFTRSEAVATAERFRAAVETRDWNDAGFPELRVTVSVGISECPSPDPNAEALLATADTALYAAKRGGRNRVEVAQS